MTKEPKTNEPIEQNITDTLEKNYMPYAMSVIVSRAIPEIDGFKPSHRKLLYTMYKMGLLNGNRTKSANVVGQTMKLNPHGDMAIYETLVRLTRGNQALLHPLIDSKGNFGKQYSRDMAYAASRYTEIKLDSICSEIFSDIDKDTIDFIDNYDGTLKEPVMLPVTFPNILVNPNQGIAVGMASNMCSFNLTEVCETAIAYLKNPNGDCLKHLLAPDFSTGGELIYNPSEILKIYETGRGSFKLRARYVYDKKNSCIDIYEIPYTTTSEAVIDKIIDAVKTNKVKDITDARDETDINGLKITIDIKRSADPITLMAKLFKITPLEDSFSCNFNVLIKGAPRTLGVKDIIAQWSQFRMDCVKRQLAYDIAQKSARLHLLLGLQKILLDIDKAIYIVRHTEEDVLVVPNLMTGFDIDRDQAEFVAEIKLRNLNKEYILKRIADIESLTKDIENMRSILSDDQEVKKLIIAQLKNIIKKYGQERKTIIINSEHIEELKEEHFIEDYNLKIFLTRDNYLKKISLASLRGNDEHKLKQGDEVICVVETGNKADLLLFSDKSTVYKVKVYEINDCKASVLGEYLPNLLGLEEDERIIYITATERYEGLMLFGFQNGKVAKVDMQAYATKTNRKKLIGAYSDKSPICSILYLPTDSDIAVFGKERALVCNTALINIKTTRSTQGIQVYNSKRNNLMEKLSLLENAALAEPEQYRIKKIPSAGVKLKEGDQAQKQISLFD